MSAEVTTSAKRAMTPDEVPEKKLRSDEDTRKVVKENEVGITSYINRGNTGFLGTIKQLYSDFQVNEIGLNGKVVHLTDDGLNLGKSKRERRLEQRAQERKELENKTPEEIEAIKQAKKLEDEKLKAEAEAKPKYELSEENKAKLLELITETELEQIKELFTTGNNMETTTTFTDKDTRTKLHQLLRNSFQGKLESVTSDGNTIKIAIAKKNSRGARPHPQDSISHVDANGVINYGLGPFKPYLHFTVFKENRETMEVANTIAKFLRLPNRSVKFAGTKDRRGATAQMFSIQRAKVVRVNALNNALKGSVLGCFSYQDQPLGLGDLKGNEFTITLRNVRNAEGTHENIEEIVKQCFDSLKTKGFINYYGMQRFGSFSISTHALGILILKSDWKAAAELILSEQDIVAPDSVEARRIWAETKNPSLTLKKMPRRFSAEHSILTVLDKEKLDEDEGYSQLSYFKAIMSIPKNLKIMYAHAYQSYIWNLVASKRIDLFGLELQVGDLVYDSEVPAPIKDEEDDFEEDVAVNREVKVKALTQEDIDSNKYTIYDVVLPSPGYKIKYPENEQLKQVYIEAMAQDGLDPFDMKRKVIEFSLAGSYRHLVSRPENLTYELVKYSEDVPLMKTDLEILTERKQRKEQREKEEADKTSEKEEADKTSEKEEADKTNEKEEAVKINEKEEADKTQNVEENLKTEAIEEIPFTEEDRHIPQEGGDKIAVILKMQLGVSTYATMALREFMKADTSRFGNAMK